VTCAFAAPERSEIANAVLINALRTITGPPSTISLKSPPQSG
jgi:hypothetical protein